MRSCKKVKTIKRIKKQVVVLYLDGGNVKMKYFLREKEILPVEEITSNWQTEVPCCNCSYSTFFGGTQPRLSMSKIMQSSEKFLERSGQNIKRQNI